MGSKFAENELKIPLRFLLVGIYFIRKEFVYVKIFVLEHSHDYLRNLLLQIIQYIMDRILKVKIAVVNIFYR